VHDLHRAVRADADRALLVVEQILEWDLAAVGWARARASAARQRSVAAGFVGLDWTTQAASKYFAVSLAFLGAGRLLLMRAADGWG
jgi:hypothetical protein